MRLLFGFLLTFIAVPAIADYSGPSAPVAYIAAGATSGRAPIDRAADFLSPKDFGAYGDVLQSTSQVTATANQCAITVAGGSFSPADVGKVFDASGLGATYGYGGVAAIAVSSAGSGYTAPPTVSVSGGTGGAFQAEMTVVSATVAAGGTGYSTGTLSVAGAIPGTFATFSITQSGGVVTAVTLLTGGEYLYVPGTSAVATTTTDGGTGATLNLVWGVGAINVVSPGVGYPTSGATATLSGGLGAGAVATTSISGTAISNTVVVTAGGAGYTSAPTATFVGGDGSGAAAGAVTVSGGAVTAVAVSSGGSGYSTNPAAISFSPAAPGSPAALGAVSVTPWVDPLSTSIASVQSSTGITLAACPSSNSSAAQAIAWGHDDTAAVQAALNTGRAYLNAQFLVTSSVTLNNGVVFGQSNAQSGLIGSVAMPSSSPILIGGGVDTMRDLEVQYDGPAITDQETSGQRVAISGTAGASSLQKGSQLSNLLITHVGTAMSASGTAGMFSVTFNSWRISDWSYRGFDVSATNRTGNVYQNLYMSLGRTNADRGFSLSGFAAEERLDQINVEHSVLNTALYIGQVKGLSVGTLHIEGDQQRGNGTGYVKVEDTSGSIDALSFYNTRMAVFSAMALEIGSSTTATTLISSWSSNRLQINVIQAEGLNAPNAAKYPSYPITGLAGVYLPMLIGRTPTATGYYTLAVNSYVWDSYNAANAALNASPTINSALQISYERFAGVSSYITGNAPYSLQAADGTTNGGNSRGTSATDLQRSRAAASNVASGAGSTIVGGVNNTASGVESVAGGFYSLASGSYSTAFGQANTVAGNESSAPGGQAGSDHGLYGELIWASGKFSVAGDAEGTENILRGSASGSSPFRLSADGNAAGSANCFNLGDNQAASLEIKLVARDWTTPGAVYSWTLANGLLTRGTGAASVAWTAGTSVVLASGTTAGAAVSVTADATNGCLNIGFTPPSANGSDVWHAVARLSTVEVQ